MSNPPHGAAVKQPYIPQAVLDFMPTAQCHIESTQGKLECFVPISCASRVVQGIEYTVVARVSASECVRLELRSWEGSMRLQRFSGRQALPGSSLPALDVVPSRTILPTASLRSAHPAPPPAPLLSVGTSVSVRRRSLLAASLLVVTLCLWYLGRYIVQLFHWAEHHVDRNSHWHAFLFFLVTLPFHTGVPIPIVHQVWAMAIGCFFRWRAFPILVASLSIGIPMAFLIGRRLASCAHRAHAEDGKHIDGHEPLVHAVQLIPPSMVEYLTPLRRAIAMGPIRSSFLLMWAPLPSSSLPLLLGALIPSQELPLSMFVAGALPSRLLHFACDVLVGIEAGSLARALDAQNDADPARQKRARTIAVGMLSLTIGFVLAMGYTIRQALKEMRAKEADEASLLISSPHDLQQ